MPPRPQIRLPRRIDVALWIILLSTLLTQSSMSFKDPQDKVRRFTRQEEFDFVTWTMDAMAIKLGQFSLRTAAYLTESVRRDLVLEYAGLVDEAAQGERELLEVYADPLRPNPMGAAAPIQAELKAVRARLSELQPVVEAILQEQVGVILNEMDLTVGGAPFPPVAFHFSRLPLALIVSPRNVIRQDANIQVEADLSLERQVALEKEVEASLGVSALVEPVGGIGTYPTMVQESGSVNWLTEAISHEWVHNYLTLRPLGWNYEAGPELRTMNETTASLVGNAIGQRIIERYYPERVPPPPGTSPPISPGEPPAFEFRAEMHETRITVDTLLAEGRVDEAESYMEAQRRIFLENGYLIRRLNQAYFAFHGAYADEPGGPAGEDPVGAAVRQLRAQSPSLAAFLRRMAWMNDYSDLQAALGESATTH